MKVLITGLTGLIGIHLARFIVEDGQHEVFGFKRWRSNVDPLRDILDAVELIEGDVTDPVAVETAIERVRPDRLYHLAAQSYPSESMIAPAATFVTNVVGTVHVLEAVRRFAPACKVHLACSSAQYGIVRPDEVPIAEEHPCRPVNPYGTSKLAQELLGRQYFDTYGLQVYMTRSFNHIGPWQDGRTSVQAFALQLAKAQLGLQEPVVRVGNLFPRRDYLDVRDAIRALWVLPDRGEAGEVYNLCSGRAPSVADMLETLIDLAGIDVRIEQDERLMRPVDEPILLGDHSKLTRATGWEPQLPFRESLASILEHWRDRLKAPSAPDTATGRQTDEATRTMPVPVGARLDVVRERLVP